MRIIFIFLIFISLSNGFDFESLQDGLRAKKIEGNFTQIKVIKNFPAPFISSGEFSISDSKTLIWKNIKPINETIKIDENGFFTLDENSKWKKVNQSMDKDIFLDLLSIKKDSLQKIFSLDLKGDSSLWILVLKPKENILKEIFDAIKISGDSFVREFELNEKNGDKSTIKFTNLKKTL